MYSGFSLYPIKPNDSLEGHLAHSGGHCLTQEAADKLKGNRVLENTRPELFP